MAASNNFSSDFKMMGRLTIFSSLGFFFLDFLIPYVASLEINASGSEMGILFSIRTVGYFILAPIAGSLTDKYSNKLLVFFGSAGRGIAYFLLYWSIISRSLSIMIAGNFLLGFMAGFYWIPLDNLVSLKSKVESRSEAFGIRSAYQGWGVMIGALVGFGTLNTLSELGINDPALLYIALVVYGISNIVGGFLFYIKVDEAIIIEEQKVKDKKLSYLSFLKSLRKPFLIGFLVMLIVLFLSATNGSIAKPYIIVYLTEYLESDPTRASMAFIPSGLFSMLLAPKLGKVADRLNVKIIISVGAILGALITWLLINTDSLFVFSGLLIIDTTIATTTGLVIHNILSQISIENRGKVFGLTTIFEDLGSIFGPVFGGFLWDGFGYRSPFIFSIIVEILLVPLYIYALIKITPFLTKKLLSLNK